jgi:hypothetical protein
MLDASELEGVIREYAAQIARMRACLSRIGRTYSDREIALAWAGYSDSVCASWLLPPDDDDALTDTLLEYLPRGNFDDASDHQLGPGAAHPDTQEYRARTVYDLIACRCNRCGRRLSIDDSDWHERLSLSWRGGFESIFGDGNEISIDLCQECVKETLGPWLQVRHEG